LHGAITKGYSLLVFLSILFSASNAIILCFNGLRNKFKVGLYYFGTAFSFVVLIYYFYEFWGKSPAESFLLARIASWALFVIIPILDLYISDHIDFHFSVPKRFAIFAANNAIIAFSISIFTEWDSIVVHSLGGERINGIYKSIDFLALAPNIIGTVITTQLLPQYSRMDANKSYQKMQKHFLKLTNYFLMLTPIIVLLSLVISKQLIKFVFTQEIADEGWHMFPVIILGSMFYVSVVPASSVLQASGKEKVLRNLLIIITTTFAVFSIICFKIFGVYGVIFLAVLLAIVFWISVFTRTRKFLNQKIALAQQKI
jgi:O-antigen/teichoic acid export membrane protein